MARRLTSKGILDTMQTFTLDEFTTGAWIDRPEYSSDQICFEHITQLHEAHDGFIEWGQCGETGYLFFLHMHGEFSFQFYLYQVCSWEVRSGKISRVDPFFWVYGRTFDGIKECSGAQNFSGNLLEMAKVLGWVHEYCCSRWPRFAEWYE